MSGGRIVCVHSWAPSGGGGRSVDCRRRVWYGHLNVRVHLGLLGSGEGVCSGCVSTGLNSRFSCVLLLLLSLINLRSIDYCYRYIYTFICMCLYILLLTYISN